MAKLPAKMPSKVAAVVSRVDPLLRLKRAKLRRALGLDLEDGEAEILAKFPRPQAFKPEEVIPLLGDPERGIPRMLPVDVALSRLGMSMFKIAADGSAERVRGKLHDARLKADRQIAEVVAKTRPPKDFFPEGGVFDLGERPVEDGGGEGGDHLGPAKGALLGSLGAGGTVGEGVEAGGPAGG